MISQQLAQSNDSLKEHMTTCRRVNVERFTQGPHINMIKKSIHMLQLTKISGYIDFRRRHKSSGRIDNLAYFILIIR